MCMYAYICVYMYIYIVRKDADVSSNRLKQHALVECGEITSELVMW